MRNQSAINKIPFTEGDETALYTRLSRDDELTGESNSIKIKENYSCNMRKVKAMQTFRFMWTTGIREQTLIDLILSG